MPLVQYRLWPAVALIFGIFFVLSTKVCNLTQQAEQDGGGQACWAWSWAGCPVPLLRRPRGGAGREGTHTGAGGPVHRPLHRPNRESSRQPGSADLLLSVIILFGYSYFSQRWFGSSCFFNADLDPALKKNCKKLPVPYRTLWSFLALRNTKKYRSKVKNHGAGPNLLNFLK